MDAALKTPSNNGPGARAAPKAADRKARGAGAMQYAALPFRNNGRRLEVLLVTSRDTGRWVIPKGWPMKGRKPYAAAALEALEEAGVKGRIGKHALGAYDYLKRLKNGLQVPCQVKVYALEVMQERASWLEMGQRERRWFAAAAAAEVVDEDELRQLILDFSKG